MTISRGGTSSSNDMSTFHSVNFEGGEYLKPFGTNHSLNIEKDKTLNQTKTLAYFFLSQAHPLRAKKREKDKFVHSGREILAQACLCPEAFRQGRSSSPHSETEATSLCYDTAMSDILLCAKKWV